MVLVRGALNFSQLASSACRMGNPSLVTRRAVSTVAARAQQPRGQPTYGDVFNSQGNIRDVPITPEDTARMRSAENVNLGQTIKGGTAAKMQSAVDRAGANSAPRSGTDEDDFFSQLPAVEVAGEAFYATDMPSLDEVASPDPLIDPVDVGVGNMAQPGGFMNNPVQPPQPGGFANNPVQSQQPGGFANTPVQPPQPGGFMNNPVQPPQPGGYPAQGPPATGRGGGVDHPVTIGEALEVAGEHLADKPVTQADARIIQSAESRATGNAPGVKRVVAAEAQVAANRNNAGTPTATVKDVLHNAAEKMPIDKVVTHQDAARVQAAEKRNTGGTQVPGGIASTVQSAADKNAASNFEPRTGGEGRIPKT